MGASVSDTAPEDLRGTAFGVYYLSLGVASLVASTAAGALWVAGGAVLTFNAGAAIALIALLVVVAGRSKLPAFSRFPRPAYQGRDRSARQSGGSWATLALHSLHSGLSRSSMAR